MSRQARIDVPGYPRHICIRAVDGMPCLDNDFDRTTFMRFLGDAMEGADFSLHAFVLMTNHVHLLATAHSKGTMSKVMHSLALRYAGHFNRQRGRRGPLFQGRFWASVIDSQRYLFQAMRYIELNPVRAGMVDSAAHYPWSSFGHNAGHDERPEITWHGEYLGLGGSSADRRSAWADFVSQGIAEDELGRIRKQFRRNHPYGSAEFEERHDPKKNGTRP